MISKFILLIFTLTVVFTTFRTTIHLIFFLSNPTVNISHNSDKLEDVDVSHAVLVNAALLCAFIIQHSVMACTPVKQTFRNLGVPYLDRSVYLITLYAVLQHLVLKYWIKIPDYALWNINTPLLSPTWCVFASIHGWFWYSIYVGAIIMDLPELLGVRQIVYHIQDLPEPLTYKSRNLQRLISHQRHPCLVGFLVILLVFPHMTLDRALLSVILILYMLLAWRVDYADLQYQKCQLLRKENELSTSY